MHIAIVLQLKYSFVECNENLNTCLWRISNQGIAYCSCFLLAVSQNIVALISSKVQHSAYLYHNKILKISVYPNFTFATNHATKTHQLSE